MYVRPAAVLPLLILLLQLARARPDNNHGKRNENTEATSRIWEDRPSSGRRWTTSRNSPYQKIVSSYEQDEQDEQEVADPEQDEAKAKTHKRKQWRTSAAAHDQIPSETSSASESEPEADTGGSAPEAVDEEVHRSPKTTRRRSTTSQPRGTTSEPILEPSTPSPKKRRRPSSTTTTTTLAPQTMSDSLYQYFRPLDRDVPQDDIIPFLDFGRKLAPVIPTPSGVNSIENRSTVTKLRQRGHYENKDSISSDEDVLQEDMDVTVVKKAIERNSVPRGKLRVQSSGISDYYKKRAPSQVRTTENLISTSDSSTASPVTNSKLQNTGVSKKVNRHQAHSVQPTKLVDQEFHSLSSELEVPKHVEVLPEKRRQSLTRTLQRSAPLKIEAAQTAESSLVKTVIKDIPADADSGSFRDAVNITSVPNATNTAVKLNTTNQNSSFILKEDDQVHLKSKVTGDQEKPDSKILSTAVVTSVSIQESLKGPQQTSIISEFPVGESANNNSTQVNVTIPIDYALPLSVEEHKNKTPIAQNVTNVSLTIPPEPVLRNLATSSPNISTAREEPKNLRNGTTKIDTPLRSRDIYKPKAIPPGTLIHHPPRHLSISNSSANVSRTTSASDTSSNISIVSSISDHPVVTTSSTTTPRTISTSTDPSLSSSSTASSSTLETTTVIHKSEHEAPVVISVPTVKPVEIIITDVKNTSADTLNKEVLSLPPAEREPIPKVELPVLKEKQPQSTIDKIPDKGELEQEEDHVDEENTASSDNYHFLHPVDTESVPPPIYEYSSESSPVPIYSPENTEDEDQFPILFTTLSSPTVPVTDTRPDTEAAVVEEQMNSSTPKPAREWTKAREVNKEVEVVYPDTMGLGTYLLAALGVVPVVVGALIGARFLMVHNKKKVLDESEYSSEYNRSPLGVSTASPLPTKLPRIPTHVSWPERETEKNGPTIAPVIPSSSRWEFPREKLRLQTLLGQGNFGQVWKAEADDIAGHEGLTRLVAVKTVKESANTREREDLLRELGIMQELGSHPNVVTLLGCCTEKEPIYLMMEYVMYGKLLSFLRDHRTRAHYYNFSDATDALTSRDLTVFGYCVARGMDYLSNKSIIHRDLAARNVLVDHNKLCKIADFGMSRNVRDTGQIYEQRQSKGALPIRWMAPESLHFSLFTHKTDVWSFGILMWEIVTLGSTPYATMGAREVMRRVRDGYRLDRPSHCRPELFRVIAQCWHSEPSKRPTFAELKAELAQLLSDSEHNGSYVDLDSFADEMRRDTLHRHH